MRILENAWDIEDSAGLSWWDSLIISSALDCEATTLLSEDMQDGLAIRSLEILNPFSQHFDMNRLNSL
jgi:predicted nucleic acid-binding protein